MFSKLTFKRKHYKNFTCELIKAKEIAEYAIIHKVFSSSSVKHIGLKAMISNQILRKYGRNKTIKKVHSIKLIVPSQGIFYNKNSKRINIPCLKLNFDFSNTPSIIKINQIEIDNEYFYVCCEVEDEQQYISNKYIGVDRNATSHIAVCSVGNKVIKLGKNAFHTHRKYKNIRKTFQKLKKFGLIKQLGKRESNIVKDINHKISKKIVELAKTNGMGIKLEDLKGIKKNKKNSHQLNDIISNWSFYQLGSFIQYKAKLHGVPVVFINPYNTSKICSRCGVIGDRNKKLFKCLSSSCRHVDHADANASFNIAAAYGKIKKTFSKKDGRLLKASDLSKESTDTSRVEILLKRSNHRILNF